MNIYHIWLYLLVIGLTAGCASYQPLPLDTSLKTYDSITLLKTDTSKHNELPEKWRNNHIYLDDGLNEIEVIQLSVLNSPKLQAIQTQLQESQAKLVKAGLLPDPQLSISSDIPRNNDPALVPAYNFGLGFDLQLLITRSARKNTVTELARSKYLQVLWQEWQIIQQTRILYRRALIQQQQIKLTHDQFLQTQSNWQVKEDALYRNNATLDAEGLARTSMMDAQSAWFEGKRQYNRTIHNLALLLGLSPQATLLLTPPLKGLSSLMVRSVHHKSLQMLLDNMKQKRPDLLALQAAYTAQESKVQEQIISQFPSFSIGANSIKDTSGIWTLGPFINMNLPILNRNQGNIAIARATRSRLHAEYNVRIAEAKTEVSRLLSDQQLVFDEWKVLNDKLPGLDLLMQRMLQALTEGNIDMLTYTTLQSSHFTQKIKVLLLEQAILEQGVVLDTILGSLDQRILSQGVSQ